MAGGRLPDPELRALPLIGSVDQVVNSTPVRTAPQVYRRLAALYPLGAAGGPPG